MKLKRNVLVSAVAALVVGATAVVAAGDSTPIGPLPAGPVTKIETKKGNLVAIAVPRASGGRVWRVARKYDSGVVGQVSEADVGPSIVLVFRAVGTGKTSIRLALTRGDTSSKALKSATFQVTVR